MSKRQAAARAAERTTEVGALLASLLDPKHPTTEIDAHDFLEAAQQLFAHRAEKRARLLRNMEIATPADALVLTRAIVAEIERVKQNADPTHPVDGQVNGHRRRMAQLIEDALRHIDCRDILSNWTKKIWVEAHQLARAVKRRDGAKDKPGPDQAQIDWARKQIEPWRKAKPDIGKSEIARRLCREAQKLAHKSWKSWESPGAARRWLYRNHSLL